MNAKRGVCREMTNGMRRSSGFFSCMILLYESSSTLVRFTRIKYLSTPPNFRMHKSKSNLAIKSMSYMR